jgi:hypothetical protein
MVRYYLPAESDLVGSSLRQSCFLFETRTLARSAGVVCAAGHAALRPILPVPQDATHFVELCGAPSAETASIHINLLATLARNVKTKLAKSDGYYDQHHAFAVK